MGSSGDARARPTGCDGRDGAAREWIRRVERTVLDVGVVGVVVLEFYQRDGRGRGARERDDAAMAQLLIGFSADVRSTAQNGFSVLHWVAAHGRKKCAKSLADHSHFAEGVVKVSDTGFTPQMIAWHRNHKEVATIFRGAEPPHQAPLTVAAMVHLKTTDPSGFEIAISSNSTIYLFTWSAAISYNKQPRDHISLLKL